MSQTSDHKPGIAPPLTSPPAQPHHALIAWLALALAVLPIGHVLAAALDHPLALSVMLTVARYGLLLAIGLLLRPLLPKIAIVVLCLAFMLLDVMALTNLFNIYAAVRPEPQPFIYFQF